MEEQCPVCSGSGCLLLELCPLCDGEPRCSLATCAENILEMLRAREPETLEGVDQALHYFAPHIPKPKWEALGNLVVSREKDTLQYQVSGEYWISLRLDGHGFSKAVRAMRRLGFLESEGFSYRFAECMQACLQSLMDHFHGVLGFTQSDEMIVFIKPTNIIRGKRQPHFHGGRVQKLTTLAAGLVTSKFLLTMARLCTDAGAQLSCLDRVLPHFDCRMGHYATWEEARALLMWRAYDCSVNGVSDAVYHTKGSGKAVMSKGKQEKVAWLHSNHLLPLPKHQAYGHLLVRVEREKEGFDPKAGEAVVTLRHVIEPLEGPVLKLLRSGALPDPS